MIEKSKTVLLVMLVVSSLLQSYLLAFHSSDFEQITDEGYVETEVIGTSLLPEQLLFPQRLVLHNENKEYTVLYPEHTFYRIIMNNLKETSFDGVRRAALSPTLLKLQKGDLPGVQLHFVGGVPLRILELLMPMGVDFLTEYERISTIWLSLDTAQQERVDVYLINESETAVYEVVSTNLAPAKLREFVGFGELQPDYSAYTEALLVPEESIAVPKLTYLFTSITSEQMENMLFPDPGITRNLPTRDGTEIYTDSKRGLQIHRDRLRMNYSDPIAPGGGEAPNDLMDDMRAAVQFVNQRGGWNGQFRISRIAPNVTDQGQRFEFRQFLGAYPIVDNASSLGHVAVTLQRGIVSEYERSLMLMEALPVTREEVTLAGGDALRAKLEAYMPLSEVAAVFPAYSPEISLSDGQIVFTPVWAVELKSGAIERL